jgi:hypothetical protein
MVALLIIRKPTKALVTFSDCECRCFWRPPGQPRCSNGLHLGPRGREGALGGVLGGADDNGAV